MTDRDLALKTLREIAESKHEPAHIRLAAAEKLIHYGEEAGDNAVRVEDGDAVSGALTASENYVPCPKCGCEWPDPSEQVECIREHGKCIACMVDDGTPPYGVEASLDTSTQT